MSRADDQWLQGREGLAARRSPGHPRAARRMSPSFVLVAARLNRSETLTPPRRGQYGSLWFSPFCAEARSHRKPLHGIETIGGR